MNTLYQVIKSLGPCRAGVRYASTCETTDELLANVKSGDWLLWLAYKLDVDIRVIIKAKVDCIKYMMSIVKNKDGYQGWSLKNEDILIINESLDVADAYCNGHSDESQIERAAHRVFNRFPRPTGYISPGGHLCIPIYFALSKHAELCCTSIATTIANNKNLFDKTEDDTYDKIVENIEMSCMAILHNNLDNILTESIYNRLTSIGYER